LLIVSIALVPALVFQAYNEYQADRIRQELVRGEALRLVQLVSSEQQRIIEGAQQVLTTIGSARSVQDMDIERCQNHMANLIEGLPRYSAAGVIGLDGHPICSSGRLDRSRDLSNRSDFRLAVSTGAFAIGEYAAGREAKHPAIHMAMPFKNKNGMVTGVVEVALSLDWLEEQLKKLPLPSGSAVSVSDRNGTVLARYPDGARYVGTALNAESITTSNGSGIAGAEMIGVDGMTRIVGYAPLGATPEGLRVAVGLDPNGPFVSKAQYSHIVLTMIVAGFVLALAITALLGRQMIRRPLDRLLHVTERWRNGDLTCRAGLQSDASEFGRLAAAFDAMADAQETRTHALRTALESTTDSVIVLDRAWRFTYLNQRAEALNAGNRDLMGMVVWDVFPWLEESRIGRALRMALASGEPTHADDSFGQCSVHFDAHAYPSAGGVTVFFRDVTEERRIAAALARSELELEAARATAVHAERLQSLGQLAGGIAHDFNNVLQVVKGAATLIERQPGDTQDVARLARVVMEATDRGGSITQRLLAFSRRGGVQSAALDVAVLLNSLHEILVHTLGISIEVQIELEADLPPISADRAQLETVLVNLATNARDAMPQGGRLTLSAATEMVSAEDPAHPAGLAPGRYVRIRAVDTGMGMDSDTLARAQEPFFTTKEAGVGTGLGLSMARGFAEQCCGALSIESSPGQGTTVTLWLPVDTSGAVPGAAELQEAACAAVASATSRATTPARLLIVDDVDQLRDVLAQNLEDRGYDVLVAGSGSEALAVLAREAQVDVLVTDLSMPGMNGIAVIRAARERWPGLPAVLLTGYAGEESVRTMEGPAVGPYVLAHKPITTDDLVELIESLLAARSQPSEHA
jgi:signal transduction histidine kinase/CheY-like chemotaxis protein/HAMP domain-containing protein